ncbi:MAG: hypothetical protein LBF38_11840, partial [Deltaproteobacteria bacterium]|jgi:hypothetical protein|nr:hypothetical protein [Deltaproteobacteria bacterium]
LDGPFEAWKKGSGGQESVVDMGRGFSRAGEFYVSEALLKNQARLWGLAGVMSVNHLMGAILERKMILGLRNNNDILINFANKPIKNPTLKHLMDEFQSISLNILIDHDDKISSFYFQKMINKNREYILKALGHDYQEFYSLDMANFSPKEVARLNDWLGETYGRAD